MDNVPNTAVQKVASLIKFDLHIHSIESKYKEGPGIVDESTTKNVDVLLSKLNDNNVALFSITDHNRFNVELYEKIDNILKDPNNKYRNVKNILAGVEFDVTMEEDMDKCHIITIFDANNEISKYKKINEVISKHIITDKDASYTKHNFTEILSEIGLSTILIGCQRNGINNHTGRHNSLSESCSDVMEIIQVGYINALEFQKPKVEGILIDNLKDLSLPVSLISGSDCHQWSSYPYHDNNNINKDFYHSKAKILPTFKGLLMAVTSPETRFNCNQNTNTVHLDGFNIGDRTIPLVNGINAIIGENGAGKSTILKLLNNSTEKGYVKDIINNNKLKCSNSIDTAKILNINQGEIIDKFNSGKLFQTGTTTNFKEVDNSDFIDSYKSFSKSIKDTIKKNIDNRSIINNLPKYSIEYNDKLQKNSYYITVSYSNSFGTKTNQHKEPLKKINKLISDISRLKDEDYFKAYESNFITISEELDNIRKKS